MARRTHLPDHGVMSSAVRGRRRRARRIDARATLFGLCCLLAAIGLGYLAFATPFLDQIGARGRLGTAQGLTAAAAWAVGLTAPAALAIVGLAYLSSAFEALFVGAPTGPVHSLGRRIGEGHRVFGPIRLPDGRLIPELVIGPHGVAIFEVMPPRGASRHQGHNWEVRLPDGHWVPIENPLEQASRDSERVRRWLASDDRDFVVKVHAAVIAPDQTVPRSPTCAVITRDQVPAFLASLPGQRTLSDGRLARLLEVVEAAG
jgi:hypothetical protein